MTLPNKDGSSGLFGPPRYEVNLANPSEVLTPEALEALQTALGGMAAKRNCIQEDVPPEHIGSKSSLDTESEIL